MLLNLIAHVPCSLMKLPLMIIIIILAVIVFILKRTWWNKLED